MQARVKLSIEATVRVADFPTLDSMIEHVTANGDIDVLQISYIPGIVVASVVSASDNVTQATKPKKTRATAKSEEVRSEGAVALPAQPDSGGSNPGSSVSVSSESYLPAEDTAGTSAQAVTESSVEPARVVTITDIRSKASALMTKDPANRLRISELLKKFGVNNMTELGDRLADRLGEFESELVAL